MIIAEAAARAAGEWLVFGERGVFQTLLKHEVPQMFVEISLPSLRFHLLDSPYFFGHAMS